MCWEHPEVCKHEAARWVPLLHPNQAPPAHPSPRCLLEPIDLHGRGAHKGWSLGDGLCLESHMACSMISLYMGCQPGPHQENIVSVGPASGVFSASSAGRRPEHSKRSRAHLKCIRPRALCLEEQMLPWAPDHIRAQQRGNRTLAWEEMASCPQRPNS